MKSTVLAMHLIWAVSAFSSAATGNSNPQLSIPSVHIVHADGSPAAGARVTITTSEGKLIIGTTADSGVVTFPDHLGAKIVTVAASILKKPSGRSGYVIIEAVPAKTNLIEFPLTIKLKE